MLSPVSMNHMPPLCLLLALALSVLFAVDSVRRNDPTARIADGIQGGGRIARSRPWSSPIISDAGRSAWAGDGDGRNHRSSFLFVDPSRVFVSTSGDFDSRPGEGRYTGNGHGRFSVGFQRDTSVVAAFNHSLAVSTASAKQRNNSVRDLGPSTESSVDDERGRMRRRADGVGSVGSSRRTSGTGRALLQQDGGASGSAAVVVISVSDGVSLFEILTAENTTAMPSVTILVKQDLSFEGFTGQRVVQPDANITVRGDCENRRCVIDGATDSTRTCEVNGVSGWGSLSLVALEFRNLEIRFQQVHLGIYNCVFRKSVATTIQFVKSLEEDGGREKTLVIDRSYFLDNPFGVFLQELPRAACVSRSVFAVETHLLFALRVHTAGAFGQEKSLIVYNCTFGYFSPSTGSFQRGDVKLELGYTTTGGESLDANRNTTISFIDCTLLRGESSDAIVLMETFSGNASESEQEAPGGGSPFQHVRFCGVETLAPPSRAVTSGGNGSADVKVTWIGGNRSLEIQLCPLGGEGSGHRDLKMDVDRPDMVAVVENNAVACRGCTAGPPACAGVGKEEAVSSPEYPLERVAAPPVRRGSSPRGRAWILPVTIAVPSGAVLLFLFFIIIAGPLARRRGGDGKPFLDLTKAKALPDGVQRLRSFTVPELEEATGNFTTILGQGGSAVVYKATLPATGEEVAIKALKGEYWRSEADFLHELGILGRISHRNLVQLLGYCYENERYFLVYEFVPGGTLKDGLLLKADAARDVSCLDWPTRMRIAHEVANALEYLHHLIAPPVVHRDIKPENVLLLEDFTPKVADFGLCRKIDTQGESLATVPAGTLGYLAPEVYAGLSVTEKVDVYSYGVLVLELVTGRRPFGKDFSLVQWVRRVAKDEESAEAVADARLQGAFDSNQLFLMTLLARRCLQRTPDVRPTMQNVTRVLEKIRGLNIDRSLSLTDENWHTDIDPELMAALYVPRDRRKRDNGFSENRDNKGDPGDGDRQYDEEDDDDDDNGDDYPNGLESPTKCKKQKKKDPGLGLEGQIVADDGNLLPFSSSTHLTASHSSVVGQMPLLREGR